MAEITAGLLNLDPRGVDINRLCHLVPLFIPSDKKPSKEYAKSEGKGAYSKAECAEWSNTGVLIFA
jgi:hypothetical protein